MNSILGALAFSFIIINIVFGADEDPDSRVFEGDIVLTKYERDHLDAFLNGTLYTGLTRNAMIPGKSGTLWPRGVVPYTFAKGHFREQWKRDVIENALDEYHRRTCIRFKWRTTETNYINMAEGRGCNSQLGMVGRTYQTLNLGQGCINFGTVIHELMHAMGFWHEQSRADRDQYVWIYENNIMPGMKSNFRKYGFNKIQHLGTTYDYCSVMHYPGKAFSVNGRATIVPKQKTRCVLGANQSARGGFSATDVVKLNKLYKCSGGGTKPTPKPTPTGTCVDDNTNCAGWAQSGECQKNSDWMLKNCRKSCKQCSTTKPTPKPTPTGTCVDDNTSCPGWAKSGECQNNPDWMLKNCRKSCKQCSTTSNKCVDKDTKCPQWASGGHCSTSPVIMHKNCAKSCNTCGTTTSKCKDKIDQCGSIASAGYCSNPKYKSYLAENCKKSCRFC